MHVYVCKRTHLRFIVSNATGMQTYFLWVRHRCSGYARLPAIDEPPADVPSSRCYHYFCVAAHVAAATSGRHSILWPS